jgi:XTP/dITP diphosphohydrolase
MGNRANQQKNKYSNGLIDNLPLSTLQLSTLMNKLLIATNNQGKIKEFHELLTGMDVELLTPSQIGLNLDVVEDGKTYAENATKKVIAFANASGLISLADDSGLEVDALNGAPGLYSARYGSIDGNKLSDSERRKYLLSKLMDKPRPWTARFRAVIAIAKDNDIQLFEGICEGEIIPEERGAGGFGYDPIFFLPAPGKTMAELPAEEKNRLSHRARAAMKAKRFLEELIRSITHQDG